MPPSMLRLFVDTVFHLHGIPEVNISDRDPRFVSKFWEEMFSILGTDLRFSIAFHLETDRQSEVTIPVIENFLRPSVEHRPSTWVEQLSLAEFVANNAVNISIGYTLFYLNQGTHPITPSTVLAKGTPKGSNQVDMEGLERMKMGMADV